MTIHNATVTGLNTVFNQQTLHITGLNGSITLGLKVATWVIVLVGVSALFLLILNTLKVTALSKYLVLIPLAFSSIYSAASIIVGLGSEQTTMAFGGFLIPLGSAIGLYVFILNYLQNRPA